MKFRIVVMMIMVMLFVSCMSTKNSASDNAVRGELMAQATWTPAADSYGSSYKAAEGVVVDGEIEVEFTIAKKAAPDEWPYVELICATGTPLTGVKTITIEYKCERDLKIKLSQSDFGPDGDSSYAHYYTSVPASNEWTTKTVYIKDFKQPDWAPESAKGVDLNLSNVEDIYLVPAVDYEVGESAVLNVKSLVIQES